MRRTTEHPSRITRRPPPPRREFFGYRKFALLPGSGDRRFIRWKPKVAFHPASVSARVPSDGWRAKSKTGYGGGSRAAAFRRRRGPDGITPSWAIVVPRQRGLWLTGDTAGAIPAGVTWLSAFFALVIVKFWTSAMPREPFVALKEGMKVGARRMTALFESVHALGVGYLASSPFTKGAF